MQEAPEFPLLPYSTGYQGKSIKNGGSLNKFTILTSLVRILNFDELQQVASDLYSPPSRKSQYDAWAAFRDAVAEAGTGPAFLIIQDSIQSKKSRATKPQKLSLPCLGQYKREVQSEEYLNETALDVFSTLVRNVYVDIKKSKNEYPVRSFGNFRTNEGLKMVDHVVGYLTQQLHEAVSRADTQKIHTYIKALGNVGHPKILPAFEPYLEGPEARSLVPAFLDGRSYGPPY
ncbi:hypothetical protein NQ318_003445 [Aromia moschata]|uniref:Vitellogenin domain-containing protein n=1 Tax=Aromia moschata TaxID=1265417 RepID=A0AAV8YUM3_9CUCU|nr:hypothetical protein NQ318_003445 [Aromia moschata]